MSSYRTELSGLKQKFLSSSGHQNHLGSFWKTQTSGFSPRVSDASSLGLGLRICIPNKFPEAAADLGTSHRQPLTWRNHGKALCLLNFLAVGLIFRVTIQDQSCYMSVEEACQEIRETILSLDFLTTISKVLQRALTWDELLRSLKPEKHRLLQ